jgi:hypothetical protein
MRALKNHFSLSDYTPAYRRHGFEKNDSRDFSIFYEAIRSPEYLLNIS